MDSVIADHQVANRQNDELIYAVWWGTDRLGPASTLPGVTRFQRGRPVSEQTKLRRSSGVVHQELEDGVGLLHLATGSFFCLNSTGALIWELIGDGLTKGELLAAMTRRLESHPVDVADQIDAFLDALGQRGLVELGSPP